MRKKLQQQIVGGIFIVAALLLFVPYFLSSSNTPTVPDPNPVPAERNNREDLVSVVSVTPRPIEAQSSLTPTPDPIPQSAWDIATGYNNPIDTAEHNASEPEVTTVGPVPEQTNIRTPEAQSLALTILQENQVKPEPNTTITPVTATPAPLKLPEIRLMGTALRSQPTTNNPTITRPAQPRPVQAQATENFRWYVQIGVFNNETNATVLMDRYKQAGYPVYIDKTTQQRKVRLGPYKTKQNAQAVQTRLKGSNIASTIIELN